MKKVALIFGTRPEAIKMAPVYLELEKMDGIEPLVLSTGQHREQLVQALRLFDISLDYNLDLMTDKQTLPGLASRMILKLSELLQEVNPDLALVHGDTLTTFVGAWVSFMKKIPVGHVEAGLRSHDLDQPFPEESNRLLTDSLTVLNFAPTQPAKENLLAEGKNDEQIIVTGQTGVDAINLASQKGLLPRELDQIKKDLVTVTLHRRENWEKLPQLAKSLKDIAEKYTDLHFVYPVHLNPIVQNAVKPVLKDVDNFTLLDPLEYGKMAALLYNSELIITDSGGIQEEGASLNKPVIVARNVTERPEGIDVGLLTIAGNNPDEFFKNIDEYLSSDNGASNLNNIKNPYGDGLASIRVAKGVAWKLGIDKKPADWSFSE